jgi:hypothetical protein
MSSGFSVFVIVTTILNIVAAVWLLSGCASERDESQVTTDTTGHVWDGDLREYNNPLPRWWLWLFVLSVIFSIGYLVLYPGMGNVQGTLGWTQKSQFDAMQAEQEKKVAGHARAVRRQAASSWRRIRRHEGGPQPVRQQLLHLPRLGWPRCHRLPERHRQGLALGRRTRDHRGDDPRRPHRCVMTPWIDVLGPKGVDDVVAHVLSLSGRAGRRRRGRGQGAIRGDLRRPATAWTARATTRSARRT